MASLKNPFARNRVDVHHTTARIVLPREDLRVRGITQDHYLPVDWERSAGVLTVALKPAASPEEIEGDAFAQAVCGIGNALGVSIPAPVRDEHELLERDTLLLEPAADAEGWDITLTQQHETEQRARV